MNRLFLQKAVYKLNEEILINFANSSNIYLDKNEASICIIFLRNHYNDILDSVDPKKYIYQYYNDPLANKMYQLLITASIKFNFDY